ncbi:MAG: sel1 repeat family protein [Pseudomonadota bacterium]
MSVSVQQQMLPEVDEFKSSDEMYRLGLEASVGGDDALSDLVTAHKWFNLAAIQGHQDARVYRAELALEMTQDQIAEAQRQARQYLASNQSR